MRSVLSKLLVFLVILGAWVTYDNWGRITSFSPVSVKDAVVHSFSTMPSGKKKSRVYQWQDAKGRVHVSNTPPENAKNVKILEYESDMNVVVPSNPAPKKERPRVHKLNSVSQNNMTSNAQSNNQGNSNNKGLIDTYTSAIKEAKEVQNLMNDRNQNLQEQLQQ